MRCQGKIFSPTITNFFASYCPRNRTHAQPRFRTFETHSDSNEWIKMLIKCFREPQKPFRCGMKIVFNEFIIQLYIQCTLFGIPKKKIWNLSSSKSGMQCWMSIKKMLKSWDAGFIRREKHIKSTNFKIVLTETDVNNFPLHRMCHTFSFSSHKHIFFMTIFIF